MKNLNLPHRALEFTCISKHKYRNFFVHTKNLINSTETFWQFIFNNKASGFYKITENPIMLQWCQN